MRVSIEEAAEYGPSGFHTLGSSSHNRQYSYPTKDDHRHYTDYGSS